LGGLCAAHDFTDKRWREVERFIKVHNKELANAFRWTKDSATIIDAVERAKQVLPI
jgi:hypothetical protein